MPGFYNASRTTAIFWAYKKIAPLLIWIKPLLAMR
jgi:hypothetical protein